MNRLKGKAALVTGAGSGSGMGAETGRLFAREGARVLLTDIDDTQTKALADELVAEGLDVIASHLDVTDEQQWSAAVELCIERYGRLDILVNNAGTPGPPVGWQQATLAEVDRVYRVNLSSQFLGIKAVMPVMTAAGGGSVVNVSSASAMIAFPDVHPGYTASKSASRMLTKSAAADLAQFGIRVNSIHPGLIDTPMAGHFSQDAEILSGLLPLIPLGRMGQSVEIANAILFFASDEASYVTGAELLIDGGYTTR